MTCGPSVDRVSLLTFSVSLNKSHPLDEEILLFEYRFKFSKLCKNKISTKLVISNTCIATFYPTYFISCSLCVSICI